VFVVYNSTDIFSANLQKHYVMIAVFVSLLITENSAYLENLIALFLKCLLFQFMVFVGSV